MHIAIRNTKEFWLGCLYILTGICCGTAATRYNFGSTGRMGPGYFPVVVSVLLVALGGVGIVRALTLRGTDELESFAWKPVLLVLGAIVLFGLLLIPAGLIVSSTVLILVSAAASRRFAFEWRAAAGLVCLVAFCAIIFVTALGVPMPLVGSWFRL